MKTNYILCAVTMLTAMLCSCEKTPDFIPELSIVCKGTAVEAGASTELKANYKGDIATIKVSTNCTWAASCAEEWVELSPSEGEQGSSPLKITILANPQFDLRTAEIRISSKDYPETSCTIKVSQGADNPFISLAPEALEFEEKGETKDVTVDSNCGWTVTSSETWLTIDVKEGSAGSSTIKVTAAANATVDFRTAKLTVANDGLGVTAEVAVRQNPDLSDYYVDEYGINHGKGVLIGSTTWAPVNCGYKAADNETPGNPYGKYYQWGRPVGFGYNTDSVEEDALAVNVNGPVARLEEALAENFYKNSANWLATEVNDLWNAGSESSPVKTAYDPCPKGWRVPTATEMTALTGNGLRWLSAAGNELDAASSELKHWGFSGSVAYADASAKVLFPCAGWIAIGSNARDRGTGAFYWTCSTDGNNARGLQAWANWNEPKFSTAEKARGCNVRCVKE